MDRTFGVRRHLARHRGADTLLVARRLDRKRGNALRAGLAGRARLAELFTLLAVLLWLMHRANILRLIRGTESRIGRQSAA